MSFKDKALVGGGVVAGGSGAVVLAHIPFIGAAFAAAAIPVALPVLGSVAAVGAGAYGINRFRKNRAAKKLAKQNAHK